MATAPMTQRMVVSQSVSPRSGKPRRPLWEGKIVRQALLDAALTLVRTKGYAATSVDDLCAVASVTKGTFFHYFRNKEELAVAAAHY